MITAIIAGLVLGALGAAAHLALVWWRARRVLSGDSALAWLAYPAGLALVGVALYGAAQIAPAAAWSFVVGVFLTRWLVLRRLREGP